MSLFVASKCLLYVTSLLQVHTGQRLFVFLECCMPELRDGKRRVLMMRPTEGMHVFKTHWQLAVELASAAEVRSKELTYKLPEPLDNLFHHGNHWRAGHAGQLAT